MSNPTGYIRVSPSGELLTGNVGDVLVCLGGRVWQAQPAAGSGAGPAPANPGDNGAVATASGGLLSYLKGSVTGAAAQLDGGRVGSRSSGEREHCGKRRNRRFEARSERRELGAGDCVERLGVGASVGCEPGQPSRQPRRQ